MAYKATVLRVFPDALGSSLLIGGQIRQSVSTGLNVNAENVSGSPFPLYGSIQSINPRLTFSTYDVAAALNATGLLGLVIAATTAGRVGVELYELNYDDSGILLTGSVHRRLKMRRGLLVPRSMNCENQGDLSLDLEMIAISDGTNPPLEIEETVASPGTPTDPQRHTLGAIDVGGVTLTRVQSVAVDFGNQIDPQSAGSNPYATWLDFSSCRPAITINSKSPEQFASAGIPLVGLAATQANTKLRFRRRVPQTASFVADGTAQHITLNAAGVASVDSAWNSNAQTDATAVFRLQALFDGTNAPLVISTAATLP